MVRSRRTAADRASAARAGMTAMCAPRSKEGGGFALGPDEVHKMSLARRQLCRSAPEPETADAPL